MSDPFLDAVSVSSDKFEGALEVPFSNDPGFFASLGAVAAENYRAQVQPIMNQPQEGYDFNTVKDKLAEGLKNPEHQRLFKNSDSASAEETGRLLTHFQRMEYNAQVAQEGGGTAMAGYALGHLVDVSMLTGGGAALAVGKVLNNSRKLVQMGSAMQKMGATAGEAKFATTAVEGAAQSVAFDAGMTGMQAAADKADAESFEDNIVMGLAATATMSGVIRGVKALRGSAKEAGELYDTTTRSLDAGQNPLREITQAGDQVGQIRKEADDALNNPADFVVDDEYVKEGAAVHKGAIPTRSSMTMNSESETLNKASRSFLQDSTYSKTNEGIHIQATTADNEVDKWVFSLEGELGESLSKAKKQFFKTSAGKEWRRTRGISILDRVLDKPVNDRLGYELHRHLSTGRNIDELPEGLREMAQAIDNAHKKTYDMMKRYGVLGTEELDHVAGHMRRIHDAEAYSSFMRRFPDQKIGEDKLLSVLEESIYRGAKNAGEAMDRELARRISYILQHRVLAMGKDKMALETFLTSPNELRKQALEMGLKEDEATELARKAFNSPEWNPGEALKKKSKAGDNNKYTMLRHRIPMDLSVKVEGHKNAWKDDFLVSDLMVNDAFGLTQRYVRRGMGNAALAKRGYNSPEAIEEMLNKVRGELKYAKDRRKAETDLIRFEEAIRRVLGTTAVEESTGGMAKAAVIMGMLGKHATGTMLGSSALAAMGEIAKVVNRTGFKAILDMIPALRNAKDKELLEMFREYGYYYGNSRFIAQFSHLEDFGTNTFGKAGAAASQSAQAALAMSGMSLVDKMSRQAALIGWTNRLVKQVKNGKVNSKDFKLSEMGWKPETFAKIETHIKKNGMDMENWRLPDGRQDRETIEAFTSGAHKVVSENITRAFHGESNALFDSPIGSMFLQFRKIVLATYNKALIRGLAQPDAIALSNLVAGIGGALFVSEMRAASKTLGMDDKEEAEYMNKYSLRHAIMNDGDLAQAFVSTLSYTPELGGFMELTSLASSTLFGRELTGRSTSTTDTFFRSPAITLAENIFRGGGHVISSPFVDEPDWEDAKKRAMSTVTLQNWYLAPLAKQLILD